MKNLLLTIAFTLAALMSQASVNQKIMSQVKESDVQSVINAHKQQGYVPIWIDGFQHSTQVATNPGNYLTYFNLIFEKVSDPNDYQVLVGNSLIVYPSGSYLQFLESYVNGQGKVRFALIIKLTGNNPGFKAHHVPTANFQATFDQLKNQGYHIKTRSVVNSSGTSYTTALFEKSNVGSWISKPNLNEAQATAAMTANRDAGRTLVHMDIPTGSPVKYNLIFHQLPANSGWYATGSLTQQQLAVAISNAKNQGYRTTLICGYDVPGMINGNEVKQIRYAATFVKDSPSGPLEGRVIRAARRG